MTGQIQALFRRAHAKMMFFGSGVRRLQGHSAAVAGPVNRPRPYDDVPKSSVLANLNEITVGNVAQELLTSVTKYGTLFRATLGAAEELVVCDPDDLKTVFSADGKRPIRLEGGPMVMEALEPLQPLGFALVDNYDSWHRQRQAVAKSLTAKRSREFTGAINAITDDQLVKEIYQLRDPETKVVSNVLRMIIRCSSDVWFYILLGKRLEQLPTTLSVEFLEAVTIFEYFEDISNVYFLSDKAKLVNVRDGLQMMYNTAFPYIKEIVRENQERETISEETLPQHNFIKNISDGTLSMREIVFSTLDVLLPGMREVSTNLLWCLYFLAREPVAQERLRKELHGAIGMEEPVTPSHIYNMPYLEGCFNEAMRLRGSPWYFTRILQKDVVLSGYNIPANTSIIIPLNVIGRQPQFYPEPESFMPERWSEENRKARPSFSFIPFGFGPRVCPGRQFGMLQGLIAVAQVVRKFQVEFLEEMPMGVKQVYASNGPERQLNLAFKDL